MRAPGTPDHGPRSHFVSLLVLIWLAGAAMRVPILAVPPVLPNIRLELGMSETEVGALMGLPLALFAVAAVPGSLLIARLGITFTLILGLVITTIASAARGAAGGVISLYAATIVMGAGIAVMQPAVPQLLRTSLPTRIGLGTAVFTNGNLLGATIAVALTIPVVLPLVGQSWRLSFVIWALPLALTAGWFALTASRLRGGAPAVPGRWWPDWKSSQVWLLGLTFGSNNSIFFGVNAFLPDYLTHFGRADLITEALSAVSVAQLAVTFAMIVLAERMYRRVWPYLVFGPAALIGLIGMMLSSGLWLVAFTALTGAATAVTFVMTLSLPPVLSAPGDAHRTAAAMFTISYTCAVIVPIISGALWDLTGIPEMAFVPIGLCAAALTLLGATLTRHSAAGLRPDRGRA